MMSMKSASVVLGALALVTLSFVVPFAPAEADGPPATRTPVEGFVQEPPEETAAAAVAVEAVVAEEVEKPKESAEELAEKMRSARRKLEIAELKLEVALMEQQSQRRASEEAQRNAAEELELAKGQLEQYRTIDSKNKIEQAELSLRASKDRAQEAAEELAQIEIMYEGQDLDDRTAEFVVNRGRRVAERAAARIAIDERSLRALAQHEVPREIRKLELDVTRKRNAAEKAVRDARAAALQKRISVLSAESEIEGVKAELAKLEAKAADR